MLAAVYENSEGLAALTVREVPTPAPGPGEVRVKVAISGVNPTDWKARRQAKPPEGEFRIPNQDGAGVIDAVGAGVSPARGGERGWLLLAARNRVWGTAAEYTVIPADRAIPLPDAASSDPGASRGGPALRAAY